MNCKHKKTQGWLLWACGRSDATKTAYIPAKNLFKQNKKLVSSIERKDYPYSKDCYYCKYISSSYIVKLMDRTLYCLLYYILVC